jgi:hypothetical protein
VLAQGHVAVFLAFTLADVKHFAVKVQVRKADVAGFKAAQAATVKQSQQHPMLKQFRGQQQALYFLLAQDDGQGFIGFDAGQLNAFVFKPFHAEGEAQAIDGELEVSLGRGVVLLAQQVEVIVDLVGIQLSG